MFSIIRTTLPTSVWSRRHFSVMPLRRFLLDGCNSMSGSTSDSLEGIFDRVGRTHRHMFCAIRLANATIVRVAGLSSLVLNAGIDRVPCNMAKNSSAPVDLLFAAVSHEQSEAQPHSRQRTST